MEETNQAKLEDNTTLYYRLGKITDYKAMALYNKIAKKRNPSINKNTLRKHQMVLFETIADMFVNEEDGLLMEGLGYFGIFKEIIRHPFLRFKNEKMLKNHTNAHTDGFYYHAILLSDLDGGKSGLHGTSMDKAFASLTVNKPIAKRLKAGFKYKFKPTMAKAISDMRTTRASEYIKQRITTDTK